MEEARRRARRGRSRRRTARRRRRARRARRAPSRSRARAASPRQPSRDRLELVAQGRRRARSVAARARRSRRAQPVDGLAHLADRAALERERRRVDDRLVAVVERVQAVRRYSVEAALGRAEDRDAPVARVRVARRTRATSSSQALARRRSGRPTRSRRRRRRGRRGTRRRPRRRSTTCRRAARTARACRRPTRARALARAARSRASCTTRWRHGASQPATTQRGRARRRAGAARAGTSRRTGRRGAASRCTCRPSRPSSVSRSGEPRRERLVGGDPVEPQRADAHRRAIAADRDDEPPREQVPRVAASPGRSKSCRRATSTTSTTADASVPWFRPCSTCSAVESAASAVATCHARCRRRASPRAATSSATAASTPAARASGPTASGVSEWRRPDVVAGQHRVHEFSSAPAATTVATTSGARADAAVRGRDHGDAERRRAAAAR